MSLQVRASTYRGRPGFLVCGSGPLGPRTRVFVEQRAAAEHIRSKLRRGEEITPEDFEPRPAPGPAPALRVPGGKVHRLRSREPGVYACGIDVSRGDWPTDNPVTCKRCLRSAPHG